MTKILAEKGRWKIDLDAFIGVQAHCLIGTCWYGTPSQSIEDLLNLKAAIDTAVEILEANQQQNKLRLAELQTPGTREVMLNKIVGSLPSAEKAEVK